MAKAKSLTIADMVHEAYDDTEVIDAIMADIDQRGTAAKILSGELVLPTEPDAKNWLRLKKEEAAQLAKGGKP